MQSELPDRSRKPRRGLRGRPRWRSGRDSNPRRGCPLTAFPVPRPRPLGDRSRCKQDSKVLGPRERARRGWRPLPRTVDPEVCEHGCMQGAWPWSALVEGVKVSGGWGRPRRGRISFQADASIRSMRPSEVRLGLNSGWRRGRDSNPRWLWTTPLFESGTLNHSDTSPSTSRV